MHSKIETVHSITPFFVKKKDGTVEKEEGSSFTAFPTMDQLMIQPVPFEPRSHNEQLILQLQKRKHQVVDCTYDECEADSTDIELELEEERKLYPERKNKEKSQQQIFQERYENGDPEVGLLGDPSGKFDYFVLYP